MVIVGKTLLANDFLLGTFILERKRAVECHYVEFID